MRRLLIILCIMFPFAAQAQESDKGLSLMERGAQMLMEGLLQEMEPAIDDMKGLAQEFGPALKDFASQMGPALRGLLDEVEDWSVYHPPEMLENGDIIIRRKRPEDTLPGVREDNIEI